MSDTQHHPIPKSYKWELLVLLWFAYFLNQGDRQIFNAVLPRIHEDTGWSYFHLGLVTTIFTIFYGVCVPIAGFFGDIFKRRTVIVGSLLVFSCGTLLTGWATSLVMLIIFRSIATGIGEAFYYPSANSLIGLYHRETRATAMAVHQTSVYTGIVCGGVLAAWIANQYGWRTAFYCFGGFGVLWALFLSWRLRNDRKDQAFLLEGQNAKTEKVPPGEALKNTLNKRTLYFLSLAFGGHVFVSTGFVAWMPTYLVEKFQFSLEWSNLSSMLFHHGFAYLGVLAAAAFSDYFARKRKTVRMEVEALGMLLASPFIFLMGWSENILLVYLAFCGFGLFRGVYDSNLFVALFDVIEPKYRSTATGIMLSFAFLIGSVSAALLGWAKDHIDLGTGIALLSIVYFLSSVTIFIGLKTCFLKDYYTEKSIEHETIAETVSLKKHVE